MTWPLVWLVRAIDSAKTPSGLPWARPATHWAEIIGVRGKEETVTGSYSSFYFFFFRFIASSFGSGEVSLSHRVVYYLEELAVMTARPFRPSRTPPTSAPTPNALLQRRTGQFILLVLRHVRVGRADRVRNFYSFTDTLMGVPVGVK